MCETCSDVVFALGVGLELNMVHVGSGDIVMLLFVKYTYNVNLESIYIEIDGNYNLPNVTILTLNENCAVSCQSHRIQITHE